VGANGAGARDRLSGRAIFVGPLMIRLLPAAGPRRRAAVALVIVAAIGATWPLRDAGPALVVTKDVGPPDAIVMLASHEWERLPAAAEIARGFPRSVVLLTIPVKLNKYNCHLCSERPQWLQHEGVPATRVVVLDANPAANTYGEAIAARAYVTTHGVRRIVVVTSPYHTRRALHVFELVMQGTGVAVGITPASATSPSDPARWWRHPYDRHYVRYEWAALLYYRVRYGVSLS